MNWIRNSRRSDHADRVHTHIVPELTLGRNSGSSNRCQLIPVVNYDSRVLMALLVGKESFVKLDEAFRISEMNRAVCEFVHYEPVLLAAALRKGGSFGRLRLCAGYY